MEAGALQDVSHARAADLGIAISETGYERDDEEDDSMPAMDRLRLVSSLPCSAALISKATQPLLLQCPGARTIAVVHEHHLLGLHE